MKRIGISIAFVAAFAMSRPALAQDDLGMPEPPPEEGGAITSETSAKLGIGVARTLAGTTGGAVEYYMGDKLLIQGLFGFNTFSPDADGAESARVFAIAGAGFWELRGYGDTSLFVGGRLVLGIANAGAAGGMDGATQINIEVPLRLDYALSKLMSIHLEAGLLIAMVPEEGSAIAPSATPDSTVIALGGELFGAGGITLFWP